MQDAHMQMLPPLPATILRAAGSWEVPFSQNPSTFILCSHSHISGMLLHRLREASQSQRWLFNGMQIVPNEKNPL